MSARRKLLITAAAVLAVGVAVLLAGPPLYARWANSKSQAPPGLADDRRDAGGPGHPFGASELEGSWKTGGSSFAGYRVEETLRGDHVTVTGRTHQVHGSLRVRDGKLRTARFSVHVAAIRTPEAARDAYFRSGATMNTDRFPEAGFTLTEPASVRMLADGKAHTVRLKGGLTLHGVRHTVTFPARVRASAHRARIAGSIPVTFEDYGVKAPSLGFVTVRKQGSVEFSLSAAPSAPTAQ